MSILDSFAPHSDLAKILRNPRRLLQFPVFQCEEGLRVLKLLPEPGTQPLILWRRAGGFYGSTHYVLRQIIPPSEALLIKVNSFPCELPDGELVRALDDDYWWPLWIIQKDKTLLKVPYATRSTDRTETLEGWGSRQLPRH